MTKSWFVWRYFCCWKSLETNFIWIVRMRNRGPSERVRVLNAVYGWTWKWLLVCCMILGLLVSAVAFNIAVGKTNKKNTRTDSWVVNDHSPCSPNRWLLCITMQYPSKQAGGSWANDEDIFRNGTCRSGLELLTDTIPFVPAGRWLLK